MKLILSILLFFVFIQNSNSQQSKDYEMIGTLQLATQEIISFKLKFKALPNGLIEGTSLTDIFGSDQTATKIKGNIDWKKQQLSFYETENISTKSVAENSSFCYLHVSNAQIKMLKGKMVIQGNFKGKYSNGASCTNGKLYLIGSDYINELIKKQHAMSKEDSSKKALQQQTDLVTKGDDFTELAQKQLESNYLKDEDSLNKIPQKNIDKTSKLADNLLRSYEELAIEWKSTEIIIEVWDSRQQDGDEIAIYVDEKKVIDRFVIKKEKQTLVIPFPNKTEAIIKIYGLSEGKYRPCTANLTMRDNENVTDVVAIMKKGENVIVKLKREN